MDGFYHGKKVLVTGGGGLLATHLIESLLASGANVRAVGRRPRPAQFSAEVEYLQTDLLDSDARLMALRGAELVFHLAAVGWGLHQNMKREPEVLTANLLLNTALLDDARRAGVERYLFTSSSAVYPDGVEHLEEDTPWDAPPHGSEASFGWAKRVGEIQAQAFWRHYGMPIAIVRPANPYGPWDNFDTASAHVIPALIRRALAREQPFTVWGSGRVVRSFMYAADTARGMLAAVAKCANTIPVNLASPEVTSVKHLVELILKLSGHTDAEVIFEASKPDGHPCKIPSVRRAAEKLGLSTYVPLHEGLKTTIDWYQARQGVFN